MSEMGCAASSGADQDGKTGKASKPAPPDRASATSDRKTGPIAHPGMLRALSLARQKDSLSLAEGMLADTKGMRFHDNYVRPTLVRGGEGGGRRREETSTAGDGEGRFLQQLSMLQWLPLALHACLQVSYGASCKVLTAYSKKTRGKYAVKTILKVSDGEGRLECSA